jgi:NADH/NAD ratio-sensing transcriptional regulator Rex
MTGAERQSQAIAKALVKALVKLETNFTDDPSMVMEDMKVFSCHSTKGVQDAVEALRKHYEGEE